MFAVVWVIAGIATFSTITASFSIEMYKANYPHPPQLTGRLIGALRHRTYEGMEILNKFSRFLRISEKLYIKETNMMWGDFIPAFSKFSIIFKFNALRLTHPNFD